jgi:hypothetical protein
MSPLERALQRILWDLRGYLVDLVIIGGWVPYLYRQYGPVPWTGRLALTAEVDVLIGQTLAPGDRPPLTEILTASGFRPGTTTGTSAVWMNDPARGEKVEFMVPHTGPFNDLQTVVPIRYQHGLGGIALRALHVMQWHTRPLILPALPPDGMPSLVEVRVPTLGAYVVNKSVTVLHRNATIASDKRAKDLVYLRDLMAAGPPVVTMIADDLRAMWQRHDRSQFFLDTAMSHLDIRP